MYKTLQLSSLKAAFSAAVTYKTARNWVDLGTQVRVLYGDSNAFDSDRSRFIDVVIIPALGPECDAVVRRRLPRKGSFEYRQLTDAERKEFESLVQKKATYRGMASVYFNRTKKYAFELGDIDRHLASDPTSEKAKALLSFERAADRLLSRIKDNHSSREITRLIDQIKIVVSRRDQ